MSEIREFLNDKDIARLLGFSPEWVRSQRFLRRHGKEHVLNIDPILIGTKPRYPVEDVDAWIADLKAHKERAPQGDFHP